MKCFLLALVFQFFGTWAISNTGLSTETNPPTYLTEDFKMPPFHVSISWHGCSVRSKTNLSGNLEWQFCTLIQGHEMIWQQHRGNSVWLFPYREPDDFIVKVRVVGTNTWTTSTVQKAKVGCCCP
jgi:hypothetical protein